LPIYVSSVDAQTILINFPCILSFENVSDVKLVNKPKIVFLVKFHRNEEG